MIELTMIGQSEATPRVVYQWLRLEQLDQAWHWALLSLVCIAAVSFVIWLYRRDSVEQMRPVGWGLTALRVLAVLGLLLYFFQLEKRVEQRLVRDSKVAVLVDTSISMTREGTPGAGGRTSSLTRIEEAVALVSNSEFLRELNERHQVAVYRFDQANRPASLASIPKRALVAESSEQTTVAETGSSTELDLEQARLLNWSGIVLVIVTLLAFFIAWGAQVAGAKQWAPAGWMVFLGTISFVGALGLFAIGLIPNSTASLTSLFGLKDDVPVKIETTEEEKPSVELPENWSEALLPSGIETRLGDALKSVLSRESGSPLAGIVVLSDGRSNAGVDPREVLVMAQANRVPLYLVGLGSAERPANVELVEIDVPKRLYPGDGFSLKALVSSSGFDGQSVSVQVLAGQQGSSIEQMSIEREKDVLLTGEGTLDSVEFELEPKAIGEWDYLVRVMAPAGDSTPDDDAQRVGLEVVERKNRVLILAGGPTRDYQFVRNLLYRDRDVESHVLLQTASEQTSQEAQELLTEFPPDRAALSQYDAIVAFDPDWTRIPATSITAMEQWVAEQAGGLILVAGSVEMPKWTARSATGTGPSTLRSLSPVVLERSGNALLSAGRIEGDTAWPLELTEDGRQSEFLWVTEEAQSSVEFWEDFAGVFSFYSAYQLKPGAKALLHFGDPSARVDGQNPVYLASQYYGAGRTMFVGGGELWRMRIQGEQYFDRLYTKLVRWVSQGRLLLDSDRGVLLVDRETALMGDQVSVRAVLKNELYEPLVQKEVLARLIDPQEMNTPLVLRPMPDGSQPGVYTGQFPVLRAGEYKVQLQLGGLASEEMLSATVKSKVPVVEMQRTERNDELFRRLAVETGGEYWAGVEAASQPNEDEVSELCAAITPEDQVAYLPGSPDQVFQMRWLVWIMTLVAGSLTLEWFTRRFHRLA